MVAISRGDSPQARWSSRMTTNGLVQGRLLDVTPNGRRTWQGRANLARYADLTTSDIRRTPAAIFDVLNAEFGPLTLDVAALPDNHLCPAYYTPADDGLSQPWAPHRVWCNPPYSNIAPWTHKALQESRAGALVVALLPARTDLRWFHDHVLKGGADVRFIRGRLAFGGMPGKAPFPSLVAIWHPAHAEAPKPTATRTQSPPA